MSTQQSPTVRDSIARVAECSMPGSIQARHIHGCTCDMSRDHHRVWNPDQPDGWQPYVDLGCPAHGNAMVRPRVAKSPYYFSSEDTPLRFRSPLFKRSIAERLYAAWCGFWEGWRDA